MKGKSFEQGEVRDIAISLVALSLVFSYPEFLGKPELFLVSLFVIGIGFIGHELSHKFLARKYGFWAAFKMWPQGLILAVFLAVATGGSFVFAAPGAVFFGGRLLRSPRKREVGLIGLAGPLFNIALFAAFLAGALLSGIGILFYAAYVNVWLALFNLLPFGPLDGQKVFAWSWKAWLLTMAVAVGGFVLLHV